MNLPILTPPEKRIFPPIYWERIVVWGVFFGVLYLLRDFLFVLLMTFLISYVVRGFVSQFLRRLRIRSDRPIVEKAATLFAYIVLFFSMVVVINLLGPNLVNQSQALLVRLQTMKPQEQLSNLLSRTLGAYFFWKEYGKPGSPRFEVGMDLFLNRKDFGDGLYNHFGALSASLESDFESHLGDEQMRGLHSQLASGQTSIQPFDEWFLNHVAPQLYKEHQGEYMAKWEAQFNSPKQRLWLTKKMLETGYEDWRSRQIERLILDDVEAHPDQLREYEEQWESGSAANRLNKVRLSPEYQKDFQEYFEERRAENATAIPFNYDTYIELKRAYPQGKQAFSAVLRKIVQSPEARHSEELRSDFQIVMENRLAEEWWNNDPIATVIRREMRTDVESVFNWAIGWMQQGLAYLIAIPAQLAMALILSVFITFDWQNVRAGVVNLRESRYSGVYEVIAPEVCVFGHLIGWSFQTQVIVALCNAILIFLAMAFIGIENQYFFAALVFFCSLIPVIGIVMASIPIVIMSILQPDGSLWMGVQTVVAIGIAEFIESSILFPKIAGDKFHLHPVAVLVILAVAGHFFGIWGMILGTPVAVYVYRNVILGKGIPGLVTSSGEPIMDRTVGNMSVEDDE